MEFFGSIDAVFNASLIELEAAGLPASAAQSLGMGRSARAKAAGIQLVAQDCPAHPSRLRQIYDPPLVLYVRGNMAALSQPGIAVVGTRHPTPYGVGMADGWHVICPRGAWSFSAAWHLESILRLIAAPSLAREKLWRCLALGWTSCIRRKIPGSPSKCSVLVER